MRLLNESIARQSNKEDEVTGRFWEGRFKSQALLGEQALIACVRYVDLNPIRAGIAQTPEVSEHTSMQERIEHISTPKPCDLLPFQNESETHQYYKAIPFERNEYLDLVDWSGLVILQHKRGAIPADMPSILQRLGIDDKSWVQHIH